MSVPPLAQPGDLAPHINGSTEEGKALGSAGEKGRFGDREVEDGRGHAKGRRGSRRKKKREKREGKLIKLVKSSKALTFNIQPHVCKGYNSQFGVGFLFSI